MATLVHGTTRERAERIIREGPNPRYHEPGGQTIPDGFSTYLQAGPFLYFPPEHYARGKAAQCPEEGSPVILIIENVPDNVLDAANQDGLFPIEFGVIQFDVDNGIEELLAVWSGLRKTIQAI